MRGYGLVCEFLHERFYCSSSDVCCISCILLLHQNVSFHIFQWKCNTFLCLLQSTTSLLHKKQPICHVLSPAASALMPLLTCSLQNNIYINRKCTKTMINNSVIVIVSLLTALKLQDIIVLVLVSC